MCRTWPKSPQPSPEALLLGSPLLWQFIADQLLSKADVIRAMHERVQLCQRPQTEFALVRLDSGSSFPSQKTARRRPHAAQTGPESDTKEVETSHLGALIAATQCIQPMTQDAVTACLLPKQPLETRLAGVIETALSTYNDALDDEDKATAKFYVQKAAQAAEEAWQQTIGGLLGLSVTNPTVSLAFLLEGVASFRPVAKPKRATMDVAREPHVVGSARRRRERRLRTWLRHEQVAIRCALASAKHHSHMRVASVATQTDDEVLAATFAATASPAATYAATPASLPVIEHVVPAPVATHVAPAPVFEHVASRTCDREHRTSTCSDF